MLLPLPATAASESTSPVLVDSAEHWATSSTPRAARSTAYPSRGAWPVPTFSLEEVTKMPKWVHTLNVVNGLVQSGTDGNPNLSTDMTGTLPVAQGGTGTATPNLVAGAGISVTGTWPNQTITSTGGGVPGGGTVTSVGLSLPATLFTVSGSPVTAAGTLTGTLAVQNANTSL